MKIIVKSKILIVENQIETLLSLILLLERAGFCVYGTQSGADGIRLAQKEEFDLVILDVNLPDKDGFAVCDWLRQDFRFSRTPVFFISGLWNDENRRRAIDLGVVECIERPIDAAAFAKRISGYVKAPRK